MGVLSSLVIGFAPLIGLGVLIILDALIISFFICAAEKIFVDVDDDVVPERHLKSRWHRVEHPLPDQLSDRISLKEHSPPGFLFS
ncbi:MAG: hypothetical protein KF749_01505 [Bacteroidetes bacterium]|nr:hypothetical protein [Bacteroidota bacterium]MCW5896190.1 hypothetical protein [Bacteroidota bacterium]